MPQHRIKGILTPLIVPLDDRGQINESELSRYIEWLISKGIHGFFPNGSTGEFTRFTFEERKRITEIVVNVSRGRVFVVAGAAEPNIDQVLEACSHYAKIGCDVVGLCSPYYFKLNQDSLHEYFSRIADRSPIPILLYNIPVFTNALSAETVKKLAEHSNIVGIKDSSRDLPSFLLLMHEIRSTRPDFVFLTGTEEMLLPCLFMGADGGILATSGIVPEAVLALYNAFQSGDVEKAKRVQYALLPLIALMLSVDFPSGFRATLNLRGFRVGEGRQPLSAAQKSKLTALSRRLGPLVEELAGT